MSREYDVGYCKPPKEHQWKPGHCPNPKGRPMRRRIDIAERLSEPLKFSVNGKEECRSPFEAGLLSTAARAIKGDMKAARAFLNHCNSAGLFDIVEPVQERPLDYRVPRDWDIQEWWEMFQKHGPPPWKGERDGLVKPKAVPGE